MVRVESSSRAIAVLIPRSAHAETVPHAATHVRASRGMRTAPMLAPSCFETHRSAHRPRQHLRSVALRCSSARGPRYVTRGRQLSRGPSTTSVALPLFLAGSEPKLGQQSCFHCCVPEGLNVLVLPRGGGS